MNDRAREVVGKLNEAQRRCVLLLSERRQKAGRATFNANAAFYMIRRGVVIMEFDRINRRDTYRLTKLGLAVRRILEENHD